MSKYFRKKTVWILLLSVALSGAGGASARAGSAEQGEAFGDASEHLLTVWSDYLRVLDAAYASELWALSYVEECLESGDWEDLTKARVACIASSVYLSELAMTEEDLTAEEYMALADAGVDTGYQSVTFQSLSGTVDGAHRKVRETMLSGLEESIFWKNGADILKSELSLARDYISCENRYTCAMTNYLLLQLGERGSWDSMEEKYPVLTRDREDWIEAEEEIMETTEAVLDEIEALELRNDEILSMQKADEYDLEQLIENPDPEAIAEYARPMTGVPALLPSPAWYDPGQGVTGYISYYEAENGDLIYPQSGDELGEEAYGMYLRVKNVSREDVVSYLVSAWDSAQLIHTQEGEDSWIILMPEYSVRIDWEDDAATILFRNEDVTFAPSWYMAFMPSD